MGTVYDWFKVLTVGAIWAGFMGLWAGSGLMPLGKPRRLYRGMRVVLFVLLGLAFGLVETFRGRTFRSPLVFLFVGLVICGLVISRFLRHFVRDLPRVPIYGIGPPLFDQADEKRNANPSS